MKLPGIICMLGWTGAFAFLVSLPASTVQRVYRNDVYLLNTCAVALELMRQALPAIASQDLVSKMRGCP